MTEPLITQPAGGGERAAGERAGEGRRGSLRRPLTGRYVGGVAAGIARWFGLDPLLVRVAFVVLSLFGGSGFLLYALAWAIVPEDGAIDGPLREWLSSRRRPIGLLRAAAYAALAFVAFLVLSFTFGVFANGAFSSPNLPILGIRWLLRHGLQVGFLVAVTLIALSVLSHDRPGAPVRFAPADGPSAPLGQAPLGQAPLGQAPLGQAPLGQAPLGQAGFAPGAPAGDAALVDTLRRRRLLPPRGPRSPLGWLVLGLALAVSALLAALNAAGRTHISGLRVSAIALLIMAVGMVVGAFAGWARWLTVVAVAVTLGLVPVTLTRGASAAVYTDAVPAGFASQPYWSVSRSTGTEILDLRSLKQPHVAEQQEAVDGNGIPIAGAKPVTVYNGDGNVSVFMVAGKVVVTTPASGNWTLNARTSFGTITMPDVHRVRGFNAQSSFGSGDGWAEGDGGSTTSLPRSITTADSGHISIDIDVSYGDIEVRRASS